MNRTRARVLWTLWMAGGVALTAVGIHSLRSDDSLRTDRNPFALQSSAYGKLLARLSESTIDRVWHLGVEQIAPHDHDHDHHGHGDDDHDHDHGDHGHAQHDHAQHDHGEDEHEAAHAGEHSHAVNDHDHDHGDYHCEGCRIAAEAAASASPGRAGSEEPPIDRAKQWLGRLSAVKYLRTNPKSMSEAHLATVKKDIEGMLLRSYKMDPTHYGVYNSYHLFLTTHDFGGTESSREHAKLIARHTIDAVFHENEDPEPWLTAASAAMNLYLMETESFSVSGKPIPLETLKEYRSRVGFCLARFSELQAKAEEAGTWQNLSSPRQLEIVERERFAYRTYEQFDAMIARREAPGVGAPEGEVAEQTPSGDN
ncbi:MAG: hypothetical protein WD342_09745 [Verrucomicrobiales bacterium]